MHALCCIDPGHGMQKIFQQLLQIHMVVVACLSDTFRSDTTGISRKLSPAPMAETIQARRRATKGLFVLRILRIMAAWDVQPPHSDLQHLEPWTFEVCVACHHGQYHQHLARYAE